MKSRENIISPSKSEYSLKEISILGYKISNGQVKPDPERMRPLVEMPIPRDFNSLRRAIGLFAHYSKWIPDFSKKINCLVSAESFPLNILQIEAIENLKKLISNASLYAIDPQEPFTVETDASDVTIAASLSQNGRPVAFFSKTLSDSERKYPIIEKEACAIIESLKKWRHYLMGRHFYLITDQKSVAFMLKGQASKIKNDKIQRWRLELSNYNFDIKYRPGKENLVADALSRQTCAITNAENNLSEIHKLLCHPGVTRLLHWVRSKNLPYSADDIKKVVLSCPICAEVKPRFIKNINTLIRATVPLERLSLDFKGPLPTSTQNKYLLTIIDEYSRFPFAYACPDTSTESVIKCLTDLFCTFGIPAMIHSDQGASFMSSELKEFLHSRGVATSRSSPYNPRGNGQVERLNKTLWQTVQLALKTKNLPISSWESVLPQSLHSVRSLLCTSTNCTPHERMFAHPRRSSWGQSMPAWLEGTVLMRKFNRSSKYDPIVEEVEVVHPNPEYTTVRLQDGRELNVSNRHLAPRGDPGISEPENNEIQQICESDQTSPEPEYVTQDESTSPRTPSHISSRPTRNRNLPKKYDDFIMS